MTFPFTAVFLAIMCCLLSVAQQLQLILEWNPQEATSQRRPSCFATSWPFSENAAAAKLCGLLYTTVLMERNHIHNYGLNIFLCGNVNGISVDFCFESGQNLKVPVCADLLSGCNISLRPKPLSGIRMCYLQYL